jgi:hypothetical protein
MKFSLRGISDVKIKGLLITLIFVFGVLLIPSFTFAFYEPGYLPSPPEAYSSYSDYGLYKNPDNTNPYYNLVYYSDTSYVQAVRKVYQINSQAVNCYDVISTQAVRGYFFSFNPTTGLWNSGYEGVAYNTAGYVMQVNIIEANFPIKDDTGNFIYNSFNVSSPVQDTIYTSKPNVSFNANGYTTTISAYLNDVQASYWWDVTPLTTQPVTLLGADLPLVHGVNKLVFMNGSTELKTITFTYQPSVIQTYYINGVIDGQTYDRPPTVEIGKDSNTPELQFVFNGQTILQLPGNKTYSFNFNQSMLNWVAGNNTLQLKKTSDGTVLKSVKVTVIDVTPIVSSTKEPWDIGLGDPPVPPESGTDIVGWVKYIFDYIIYLITYLVTGIGTIFSSILEVIGTMITSISNIGSFMQQLFGFLPPQLVNLLVLGVLCTVIISVIRSVRGHKA